MFAQDQEFLRGKVLDQKTGEPVVFATVRILGKAKGVITNMDGSFRLPLEYREAGESIAISSMGYEKKEYELQKLSPEYINIIRLNPGVLTLTEAIVAAKKRRALSARRIVRRAIENIPKNYPTTTFTTKGYYRDYQKDSLGYVNLNEALLQVYDSGFDAIDTATTKTRIYDYVQNQTFRRDTLADDAYDYSNWHKTINNAYLSSYNGNEFQILRVHDPIRNYKLNSFDFINNISEKDIIKNHSFKKMEDTYLDEERLYTIQVKKTHPNYSALGTMYIAKRDFAIHKLIYSVYDDRSPNNNKIHGDLGIKGKLIFEVSIEYNRGLTDLMYLNYISFHNTFRLAKPPKFKVEYLMVLAKEKAFSLHFNNRLENGTSADSNDWYTFKFKNEKIKFKRIDTEIDSVVKLYPSMSERSLNNMFRELETMSNKRLDIGSVLNFKVTGLQDIDGNILNIWTYKDFDQFREFFVQEVENAYDHPPMEILMDKRRPIFDNQPIIKPDNFKDYWMNTPLKTLKE
jgi:hypothetical protein